jgi:hypothetical protein
LIALCSFVLLMALHSDDIRQTTETAPHALTLLYGLWAVAALSRAVYQYLFRHPESFVPTHISAFVGVLYLLILLGLRRRGPRVWWATLALLAVELGGVLIVGMVDLVWRPFPYATVWSGLGAGYLYIPLFLPVVGIWWMLQRNTRASYGVST